MADLKCARCEREGQRGFIERDGETVCAARKACAERSRRYFAGTPRGSRYLTRGVTGSTT